jgi:hypothetical protein
MDDSFRKFEHVFRWNRRFYPRIHPLLSVLQKLPQEQNLVQEVTDEEAFVPA